MITLLSPAKDLNTEPVKGIKSTTSPSFPEKSQVIAAVLKKKSAKQLSDLMGISAALAELNQERYSNWNIDNAPSGKTAIHTFNGEVFKSLDASSLSKPGVNYAQAHLRILSGLYGLLRPLDMIMPYRLEMGTKISIQRKKDLYAFWGNELTDAVNALAEEQKSKCLVNLASNEYFKSIKAKELSIPVVTPVFKDLTAKGDYKVKFFYAKKQRGKMARFICEHQAMDPDVLRSYDVDGYYLSEKESSSDRLVFLRDEVV